ncbi:hypothetical protein Q3G72_009250 [Acer saccharum]|nr:hypothetical protein Q3G72_009250 [Acer saccharum]
MMAVSWISSGDFGNLAMVEVFYEVRAKLSAFNNLSIRHVPRAANEMADGLAKRGLVLEGEDVVWSVF